MARGRSGRIVVEVEPDLKRRLYTVLASREMTLKDWFVREAETLVRDHDQPRLQMTAPKGQRL